MASAYSTSHSISDILRRAFDVPNFSDSAQYMAELLQYHKLTLLHAH